MPVLIGECLSCFDRPKLFERFEQGDESGAQALALSQLSLGCTALSLQGRLGRVDEAALMKKLIYAVSSVTDAPLLIGTRSLSVFRAALSLRPEGLILNSLSPPGLSAALPLLISTGARAVALLADETGVPPMAQQRLDLAKRMAEQCAQAGLSPDALIYDAVCLPEKACPGAAKTALQTIEGLKRLRLQSLLGIGNTSFGQADRAPADAALLRAALRSGLDHAIVNPYRINIREAGSA